MLRLTGAACAVRFPPPLESRDEDIEHSFQHCRSGCVGQTQRPDGERLRQRNEEVCRRRVRPASQSAAALREILSKYDVKDISPDEFSEMIQKLADKGVISQKELQDLSAVRGDLDKAGVGADESINLVEFYQQRIQEAQNAAQTDPASAGQDPNRAVGEPIGLDREIRSHACPARVPWV